ncbi:MAG: hypothetical protein COT74_11190 [Bdellovibrionales bacterium CG10_big_fil_rev_8_21_14_0_10_45_34]|nr:MAG: hypothetical protein COT74_11190 [Bdellovibrionales bacterium CG10_big_fil_rev_8_21_14_0_10_45_34]
MKQQQPSSINLEFPTLGFGCEPLGGTDWGDVDIQDIGEAIVRAVEIGVKYFDTAPIYGLGLSEERLSKYLGSKRHDVTIGTKVGIDFFQKDKERAVTEVNLEPSAIVASVEGSLRRLQIDSVPLLFVHYPDPKVPKELLIETLVGLQKTGKIREFGYSNFALKDLEEIQKLHPISAAQFQYSLIQRKAEGSYLRFLRGHNIKTFAYGVLERGLLSGKFQNQDIQFPQTDRRHRLPAFIGEDFRRNVERAAKLTQYALKYGVSVSAVAIRWLQQISSIDVCIAGVKSLKQLESNWGAECFSLEAAELSEIDSIFNTNQERVRNETAI